MSTADLTAERGGAAVTMIQRPIRPPHRFVRPGFEQEDGLLPMKRDIPSSLSDLTN